MAPLATYDRDKLKQLIETRTRDWVEVYRRLDPSNAEYLIRSLLRGAEAILLERLGLTRPGHHAAARRGVDFKAYSNGRQALERVELDSIKVLPRQADQRRRVA